MNLNSSFYGMAWARPKKVKTCYFHLVAKDAYGCHGDNKHFLLIVKKLLTGNAFTSVEKI